MKTTSFYLVILLTFQYVSIMAQSANPFTNAVQFRIARPTSQLHKIKTFYCEVLGFPLIGHFEGHDGYDGLMVGIPNEKYHLEFTQHAKQSDLPKPTRENLLVFYFEDDTSYLAANQRLQVSGYQRRWLPKILTGRTRVLPTKTKMAGASCYSTAFLKRYNL